MHYIPKTIDPDHESGALTTELSPPLGYCQRFSYFTQCLPRHLLFHRQSKNIQRATHNTNKYQKNTTGHVTLLANGHLTGSDAAFVWETRSLWVIKKRDNFADTGLAVGTPGGFDPTKVCFKCLRWFGKWHKVDTYTKLGEPTVRAACTPQCLTSISHFSDAFLLAFFLLVSVHLCHGLTVPLTKVCLLCVTPTGTYWVLSPGFLKTDYFTQPTFNVVVFTNL